MNVKCIFGPMCHCYFNGFYSKETSLNNNNYVYYCYFQISLWLILWLIGTPILWLKVNDFVFQGKTWLLEKWIAFLISYLSKFNLRQKFLNYVLILFSALGLWFLKYCISPRGWKKKAQFWRMKVSWLARNLLNFKGRAWSGYPAFLEYGRCRGFHWLVLEWISECKNVGLYHMHELEE